MEKKEKVKKAESALLDIMRGYSILNGGSKEIYFRHFSLTDSLRFEEYYTETLLSAKKSGIKDEAEIISAAIKNKKWSVQNEEKIKSLIWEIDKIAKACQKINDYFQRKSAESSMDAKRKELDEIKDRRRELCSYSAESFAETKKIKKIMVQSLYSDSTFKENLEESNIFNYSRLFFNRVAELNDSDIIANAAYGTSFFEIFSLNYRTPHVLFKKKGMDLSVFQKNLLVYANAILNKLKNVSVPEAILDDPIKILNYKEPEKGSGKDTSVGIKDLKEKSSQNNGELKPEDFLS